MNQPRIAFDIDNTLAECGKAVNNVLDACGFDPDRDHSSYDFFDTIDEQHHTPAKVIINALFDHPPFFANLSPILCAQKMFKDLHNKGYADCYITARRSIHHDTTLAWLKKHDFPELPLYTDAHAAEKASIALERGCSVLVDDHVDNAKAAIIFDMSSLFRFD
jgi:5'(3')-deoxyribonucleotidase